MNASETAGNSQTLGQLMAQGRLPVPLALRYAMILAEALRKVHDSGQVHGAVSPGTIAITRTGIELLPALGSVGSITPYTAPEVIDGRAADTRSDIFSFGAILYEMLTGRTAFGGEGGELATALLTMAVPPSGSPAVDRLVASCVAKDPALRWQRMQKLLLELKLLAVAVERAEAPRRESPGQAAAIRAEMQVLESRLTGRLEAFERRIAGVEESIRQSATELGRVEQAVSQRLEKLEHTMAEALSGMEQGKSEMEASIQQNSAGLASLSAGLENLQPVGALVTATDERMEHLEGTIASVRKEAMALRDSVADHLSVFDKALKKQNTAIESARTAMGQTDDLVERVVEALESLQSVVLDHAGDRATVGVRGGDWG